MWRHLVSLVPVVATATALASNPEPQVGQKPPELDVVKWYNTPPLSLGELQGKAVMVEVFRTW